MAINWEGGESTKWERWSESAWLNWRFVAVNMHRCTTFYLAVYIQNKVPKDGNIQIK